MRSRADPARQCPACGLRRDACLCALVPRVVTRTRFVVLRHFLEGFKSTNTGRLATLALPNSQLGSHGGREGDLDLSTLDLTGAAVLYPDGDPELRPSVVVVPDGTWQQARRMVQRVPTLRALPRFSVTAPAPATALRHAHFEGGVSTLEAIAAAVRVLEGDAPAEELLALHRVFVERISIMRSGRSPAPGAWEW